MILIHSGLDMDIINGFLAYSVMCNYELKRVWVSDKSWISITFLDYLLVDLTFTPTENKPYFFFFCKLLLFWFLVTRWNGAHTWNFKPQTFVFKLKLIVSTKLSLLIQIMCALNLEISALKSTGILLLLFKYQTA